MNAAESQEDRVTAVHELSSLLMGLAMAHTQIGHHGAMSALLSAYGRLLVQHPCCHEGGLQALRTLIAMVETQAGPGAGATRH